MNMDPSSGQPQQMSNQSVEKKPKPHPEQALKCPRCDSTSTKFCYYNNYSLSQPRYFCKSCRRYWTKGGTLRNVPVGGGCRKKRLSPSSLSSKRAQDQTFTPNLNPLTTLPHLSYDSNDFTLALARFQKQSGGQLGYNDHDLSTLGNPTGSFCDVFGNSGMNHSSANPSFFDAIRTGFLETQNHLQNLYCVYGNGDLGEMDNGNSGGVGVSGEMMLPYDQVMSNATTQSMSVMKQEMCSGRVQSERKVLGGFPWQLNADTNIGELDSGRAIASWNSFTNSWHGLLQSPLM